MSLETWKKEFYPVDAKNVSEDEAIRHSLRKWRGLTKENLEKHDLEKIGKTILEKAIVDKFHVDGYTCSLCNFYVDDRCTDCPLYKLRSSTPCDIGSLSPYRIWVENDDPQPMIALLEQAAK